MDLDDAEKLQDFRYRLVPVFSNILAADADMQTYIDQVRAPIGSAEEKLAVAENALPG